MLSRRAPMALIVIFGVSSPSTAMVIDDFIVGRVILVRDAGVPVMFDQTGLDPAFVAGGGREFLGQFNNDGQSVVIDTTTGQLTLGVAPPATLGYLSFSYGSDVQPLNLDLTADGSDRFIFDFAGTAGFGSLLLTSPGMGQAGLIGADPLFFSDFDAVDLTNIRSIKLSFGRSPGFVLNSIHTVPEPCAGILLAFGLLEILATRRRRKFWLAVGGCRASYSWGDEPRRTTGLTRACSLVTLPLLGGKAMRSKPGDQSLLARTI